jgi:hypothetical protein
MKSSLVHKKDDAESTYDQLLMQAAPAEEDFKYLEDDIKKYKQRLEIIERAIHNPSAS